MTTISNLTERLAGKIICYHGTTPENAKSILWDGFKKGSYFAFRVEDSLIFGGPYLFAVAFSADPAMWHGEENGFQFHLREAIGVEEILWHTPAILELIKQKAEEQVAAAWRAALEEAAKAQCKYCGEGRPLTSVGELEYHPMSMSATGFMQCEAGAIRALMEKGKEAGS